MAKIRGVAVNTNPSSKSSRVYNAPRPKTVQTDAPDQTTADEIALQILSDETAKAARRLRLRTYPRPIHTDRDRLRLTIPQIGRDEDFIEESWTISLNPTGGMEHDFLSVVDVS